MVGLRGAKLSKQKAEMVLKKKRMFKPLNDMNNDQMHISQQNIFSEKSDLHSHLSIITV